MNKASSLLLVVAGLCFCTALAVVYTKHLTRQAYTELSANQSALDALDVQWSQLQIEEGTFSDHGLIESAAKSRLQMIFPGLEGSVMIVRQANGSGT